MLRIHEVNSASDAKNYYAAADYYSQGQETVGQWGGKLAAWLGLVGTVDKACFDQLCDNVNPATGEPLTLRTNDHRRVLYDFTFSGPKSFSILEAFAAPDEKRRLMAAFDAAIAETMHEAEADMQTRIRKDGMDTDRMTGNMIYAGFDHSTSRPVEGFVPDPHRHRHVAVFNATLDPIEGRIKAGQFAGLKRDGEYYTAVFYSHLASKIAGLGYGIDRRGGKAWEIAGMPQALIDRFSKRTDEIEDEAARQGITDERRKAELGAKTRSKKQKELTPDQLRKAWDAQLTDGDRDALASVYRKDAGGAVVTPETALSYALAHGSEQLSVIPDRELKKVALLHGLGDVTPQSLGREMLSPRHRLITQEIEGQRMVTTPGLQAEEDAIIGFAARGLGSVAPVGMQGGLERGRLNNGQWQAVTGLLDSENRVNLVQGPAGAGKTDMLGAFREGMRLAGRGVTVLASSSDAVEVLHKEGFKEARTVAHFLLDERMQHAAKGGHVVVDETSMLGHKDAVRLFALAKQKDLKLIFVGDPMQHGSVSRGALMRILTDYAGVRPFKLTQIMRQQHAGYLDAARLLSEGRTLSGFDALNSLEWVKEIAGDQDRYQALAAEYVQARKDGKSVLVVSPTHREAGQITEAIRSELRSGGRLGATDHAFVRLVPVNASEAERGQATTYQPGDVLQFHQNAKGGFKKGDRLTVVDPANLPLAEAAKFSLYRPQEVKLAVGDVIRFTGNVQTLDGTHTLKNGASRSVAEITSGGNIRLDNGWLVGATCGHFRPGFVETSFGSQGRTVQRVILGMSAASSGAMNQEQMYVSASRGKERLSLYTDDKVAIRSAIQRSSQKLAAVDLRPKQPAKPPARRKWWEQLRQFLERRQRQTYYDSLRAGWSSPRRPREPLPQSNAERVIARRHDKEHAHER
jgi:conjugative relaxase-like TrwC/TraI family protein